VKKEAAVLNKPDGGIAYRFHARDLHLVMGPAQPGAPVRFRDVHGIDVNEQGDGTVTEQRLYQLVRQTKPIVDRQFEIQFFGSGVEAFAFTFG
jgi:thioredoxin family protein